MITANGSSHGVLLFINRKGSWAMDASTSITLYTRDQAANARDTLSPRAHFATPIPADGRVFVATHDSLVVYGLSGLLSLGETGIPSRWPRDRRFRAELKHGNAYRFGSDGVCRDLNLHPALICSAN